MNKSAPILPLSRGIGLLGAAAVLALGACDRIRTVAHVVAPAASTAPDYLVPPVPLNTRAAPGGGLTLQGSSPPDAVVSLRSPEGENLEAKADGGGRWSVVLPSASTPRLFAFQAAVDGRTVRSEGALYMPPSPGVGAVLLRAGYGAAPLAAGEGGAGVTLQAIDFDGGGGIAAAGHAAPNVAVRLTIDAKPAGMGHADGAGRFAVTALDPRHAPTGGAHRIGVETRDGAVAAATVEISGPATLSQTEIYRAARVDGGWRVDWRLPGGGTQTSLVLDPPVAGKGATR